MRQSPDYVGVCILDISGKEVNIFLNFQKFVKVFVRFETNEVMLLEEYLVYDFNDIVAAVGGSLGLFLGFSCLQVIICCSLLELKRANCLYSRSVGHLPLGCCLGISLGFYKSEIFFVEFSRPNKKTKFLDMSTYTVEKKSKKWGKTFPIQPARTSVFESLSTLQAVDFLFLHQNEQRGMYDKSYFFTMRSTYTCIRHFPSTVCTRTSFKIFRYAS